MSPQTTKLIQERMAMVPQEIITLLQGNLINETITKIQGDFSLTDTQANLLSNEVVLTVLFFSQISTLPQRIENELGVDKEVSEKVCSVVTELIFKNHLDFYLASSNDISTNSPQSSSNTTSDTPAPTSPLVTSIPKQNEFAADIAETEAALHAVPEVRTMAKDIAKAQQAQSENIHTSSQEVLLKESTHNTPKDESRWGNQT